MSYLDLSFNVRCHTVPIALSPLAFLALARLFRPFPSSLLVILAVTAYRAYQTSTLHHTLSV